MKKLKLLSIVGLGIITSSGLTSCGSEVLTHEHAFYKVDEVKATCISTGNIAYDECIYCNEIRVNDEIKTLEDVTTPIDPKNHTHLVNYEAIESTCANTGNIAYDYCEDCEKYLSNGEEITLESTITPVNPSNHQYVLVESTKTAPCQSGIKEHYECEYCDKFFDTNQVETTLEALYEGPTGDHTFIDANEALCSGCNEAYMVKENEESFVFDNDNKKEIVFNDILSVGGSSSSNKSDIARGILEKRLSFRVQKGSYSTVTITGGELSIKHSKADKSYPRIGLGENETAHIGKALFSFDVNSKTEFVPNRLGVQVKTEIGRGLTVKENQDLLLGTSTSGGGEGKTRILEAGVDYRFGYAVNLTDASQILQFFIDSPSSCDLTFKNLHYIPLETSETVASSKILYYGKADMSQNEIKEEVVAPTLKEALM